MCFLWSYFWCVCNNVFGDVHLQFFISCNLRILLSCCPTTPTISLFTVWSAEWRKCSRVWLDSPSFMKSHEMIYFRAIPFVYVHLVWSWQYVTVVFCGWLIDWLWLLKLVSLLWMKCDEVVLSLWKGTEHDSWELSTEHWPDTYWLPGAKFGTAKARCKKKKSLENAGERSHATSSLICHANTILSQVMWPTWHLEEATWA